MNWLKKFFGRSAGTNKSEVKQTAKAASLPPAAPAKPRKPQLGTISNPAPPSAAAFPASGSSSKHYDAHGLDLAPNAARELFFEQACGQVAGLGVLSKRGELIEAAKGEDYSVLLYFNKAGGLSEVVISSSTTSGFLGMGMPQPERVTERTRRAGGQVIFSRSYRTVVTTEDKWPSFGSSGSPARSSAFSERFIAGRFGTRVLMAGLAMLTDCRNLTGRRAVV